MECNNRKCGKTCNNTAETVAAINVAASMMTKGKSVEEIEMLAIRFRLLSDTLASIAIIEKKQHQICAEKAAKSAKNKSTPAKPATVAKPDNPA